MRKRKYLKIQDCFEFQCPKRWEFLDPLDTPGVKHCSECDRSVYKATNKAQLVDLGKQGKCKHAPISEEIIKKWINKVNGFEIDKQMTFDSDIVIERLSKFWLPDENILYIGKGPKRSSGKALDNRINEYYKTEYGEKRPHAGGHWIKSLSNLDDLFVYAIPCDDPGVVEIKMLEYFINNVSYIPQNQFLDLNLCLPFANLQLTPRRKKKHGLGKMKKR